MRKKLIGVLDDLPVDDEWYGNEEIADHLLANDVVKVVRCKDCIHYDFGVCLKIYSDGAVSQYAWQARKEDDFCSHGERKDNG